MGKSNDDSLSAQLKLFESITAEQDLQRLKQRLEKMTLVCRALWSFLQEHHQITEEDLARRIDSLSDSKGSTCEKCGRIITKTHRKCLYCGTDAPNAGVLDSL